VCQEEPVFLGPFLQEVIRTRPESIVGVAIAGRRGAGERRRTWAQRVESLWIFWLIFEPVEFLRSLWLRTRARVLGSRDRRSVEGLARRMDIPVVYPDAPTAPAVADAIRALEPDVVLNQSEILLDADVLALPPYGFVNRHASLLPAHRGRLGSFWTHADEEPHHGLTIHLVDEGIDTGAILEQWEAAGVDPAWSFPRVLRSLNARAPALFWSAIDRLERGEAPTPQPEVPAEPPHRFPTLKEARRYRAALAKRRARTR
jgi:folate-dependent phosphoribosylglycinamide formyltransferase PurN